VRSRAMTRLAASSLIGQSWNRRRPRGAFGARCTGFATGVHDPWPIHSEKPCQKSAKFCCGTRLQAYKTNTARMSGAHGLFFYGCDSGTGGPVRAGLDRSSVTPKAGEDAEIAEGRKFELDLTILSSRMSAKQTADIVRVPMQKRLELFPQLAPAEAAKLIDELNQLRAQQSILLTGMSLLTA